MLCQSFESHRGGAASKKKTAFDAKRLPSPKITSCAGLHRAPRHVPDSIPTLRQRRRAGLFW